MIQHGTPLWSYLTSQEQALADDGAFLVEDSLRHQDTTPTDFSYLVFPFAKLYEGFLKDAFLDLHIITDRDYRSNHFRIGKALSPNLIRRLGGKSAYGILKHQYGDDVPNELWHAWKEGRNLTFHYFPGNFRMLSREQALNTIDLIVRAMEALVGKTGVRRGK
jgi:hypothetical protein